jgi:hypothetical protein
MDELSASSMQVSDNIAFYPKAGCYKVGRNLYNLRGVPSSGELLVRNAVINHHTLNEVGRNGKTSIYIWTLHLQHHMIIIKEGKGMSITLESTIGSVRVMVHIWRIQRLIRAHQWRKRALAMAMGLHSRLGSSSDLMELHCDILAEIMRKAKRHVIV